MFAVAIAAVGFSPGIPVSAAVDISIFTAKVEGAAIHVTWRTATERGNAGFRLLRSMSNDGPWESKGEFHTSCPGCILGSNYSFTDNVLISGKTYYYKLVAIDTGKQYGPVSVSFGAPAANATATNTMAPAPSVAPSATRAVRASATATVRPSTATATRSAPASSQLGTATPVSKIAFAIRPSPVSENRLVAEAVPPTVAAEAALPVDSSVAAELEESVEPEHDSDESSASAGNTAAVLRIMFYGTAGVFAFGALVFGSLSILLLARNVRRG